MNQQSPLSMQQGTAVAHKQIKMTHTTSRLFHSIPTNTERHECTLKSVTVRRRTAQPSLHNRPRPFSHQTKFLISDSSYTHTKRSNTTQQPFRSHQTTRRMSTQLARPTRFRRRFCHCAFTLRAATQTVTLTMYETKRQDDEPSRRSTQHIAPQQDEECKEIGKNNRKGDKFAVSRKAGETNSGRCYTLRPPRASMSFRLRNGPQMASVKSTYVISHTSLSLTLLFCGQTRNDAARNDRYIPIIR